MEKSAKKAHQRKRGEMEGKKLHQRNQKKAKKIKEGGNGGFRVYTQFLLRAAHTDSAFGRGFLFNLFALIF
jgi:hypothetical protein